MSQYPGQSKIHIYPINNYSFGSKDAKPERDNSIVARTERLREKYVLCWHVEEDYSLQSGFFADEDLS